MSGEELLIHMKTGEQLPDLNEHAGDPLEVLAGLAGKLIQVSSRRTMIGTYARPYVKNNSDEPPQGTQDQRIGLRNDIQSSAILLYRLHEGLKLLEELAGMARVIADFVDGAGFVEDGLGGGLEVKPFFFLAEVFSKAVAGTSPRIRAARDLCHCAHLSIDEYMPTSSANSKV